MPRGKMFLISASEKREVNSYIFSLGFPMSMRSDPKGTTSGGMSVFGALQGVEIHAEDDDDIDVLIGMDVITQGSLKVDFDGHWSFCF